MNVLERILEEIEKAEENYCSKKLSPRFLRGACSIAAEVKEIIRSHMDNLLDTDTEEKSILCTLGEDGVLSEYDDTYDVVIHCTNKEDQEQTVKFIKDSNWIPVSERLPEDGTYLCTFNGELCGIDEPFTGMCGIENGKWYEEGCVIAWQPLPEPYLPEEKETRA